jgi:hypothetical protein
VTATASLGQSRTESLLPVELRRFRPRLNLGYHQELFALVRDIETADATARVMKIRSSIDAAEAHRVHLTQLGVDPSDLQPTAYYLATLRLLRDLIQQGWIAGTDDEGIYILPPVVSTAGQDPGETKSHLRDSFQFALADQLLSDSVARFIAKVERAGISDLFVDGPELAARLEKLGPDDALDRAVRPFLQLVEGDARDGASGIRLQDIWRYARLQWSIPYQTTPGRNLHYLIRDSAAPGNPIIGIAALGNAILGLSQRDDALGWSAAALRKRYESASTPERRRLLKHLVSFMREERQNVYSKDLDIDGRPADEAIRLLAIIEKDADESRKGDLTKAGSERTSEYNRIRDVHLLAAAGRAGDADWRTVAETHLYRRKRAANLADTIRTLAVFEGMELDSRNDRADELFETELGRRALDTTLRRLKQRAIAENVMELITCGSVAPYNQVLGGKLVSMLMTSPQVVKDVKSRYDGRVSLIASGMAGRAIVREPGLCLLTTSSLYAVGSAQYNRIRIPGSVVDGGTGEIRYDRIGTTDSYGTVQFASDTTQALVAVARFANDNKRLINNLFGEGMSPKLRSLRMGIEGLGLQPDEYLRHHSPRLLYAVPLASNTLDVLLGLAKRPKYALPLRAAEASARAISQHWYERWAKARVGRPESLPRLRATRRDAQLLSRVASDLSASTVVAERHQVVETGDTNLRVLNSAGPISFVEKLYRNSNSYADRLTEEELDWIHVDLGLDEFILDEAAHGRQIIITGNPGDGKTFVIERLRKVLEGEHGALVVTDANAATDVEILSAWRSCEEHGRTFVLAINEWPLFELRRLAASEGFASVEEAVRQVQSAVYFGAEPPARQGRVSVIDLNLRNVLAPRVVRSALDRLTDDRFVGDLDKADPAHRNTEYLRAERVQLRLTEVLSEAARRGGHTTMRQLMGYLAYLTTGGTDSASRIMSQGSGRYHYASLAFDQNVDGPLFDLIKRAFDPATVTHPAWDEELWRGTTDPTDWIDPSDLPAAPAGLAPEEREASFRVAKRRFFFEHTRGDELLRLLPSDEADFEGVLRDGLSGDVELVRKIVLAINRFFEPDAEQDEDRELKLWQSHRYDVRPPTAFVALYSQRADELAAKAPKLAEWVDAWLASDLRSVSHFAIETETQAGSPNRLLIDRDLFLTLREAAVGLGRSTWSRSVARKITRFVDGLHRRTHEPTALADLEIRNVDTNLRADVKVHRESRKYEL